MKASEIPVNYIINDTYKIICPIGGGGTGIIYLAEHMHLQKKVVLKKIRSRYKTSSSVRQEADILKSLHHMYLPQVYDFIVYNNDIFTVIDFIDGCDMDKYISSYTPVTEERLVKWMCQMCDALTYIHTRKPAVFHNDIKPANIIVNENDDICLIDFNISSDDSEAILGFTPAYASPEQYFRVLSIKRSEELYGSLAAVFSGFTGIIDGRSDLYSLGAAFYAMAARIQPNVENVVYGNHVPLTPEICGLSDGFCRIINKLMSLRTEDRYSNAEEVRKALIKLEKQDSRYKRFLIMQTAAFLASGIIVIGGIFMIVHGVSLERSRDFSGRYAEFTAAYDSQDYSRAAEMGTSLLNDDAKSKIISRSDRGNIYYLMAMSYYGQGQYGAAAEYIEESLKYAADNDNRGAYEMDAAVIYAYLGSYEQAKQHIDSAYAYGIGNDHYYMTLMQIYCAQKDYDNAIGCFGSVNAENLDQAGQVKLYELAGDAYYNKGDSAAAAEMFGKAYTVNGSVSAARKLGELHFAMSSSASEDSEKLNELSKAAESYSVAYESEFCTAEDIVNLSKVYRLTAKYSGGSDNYKKAEAVLLNGTGRFPDDYRIYQQLAVTYYNMGDNRNVSAYCEKAFELFGNLPADRRTAEYNDDMQFLDSIREQIRGG